MPVGAVQVGSVNIIAIGAAGAALTVICLLAITLHPVELIAVNVTVSTPAVVYT